VETLVDKATLVKIEAEESAVYDQYHSRDGNALAGWLKAPNGKPSHLTERHWAQVRTPAFKHRFGDWERKAILEGPPVKSVRSSDIPIIGKGPIDTAKQWIKDHPIGTARAITIDGVLDIEANENSIQNSFGGRHSKYPNKVFVLPALKSVIERGAYLGRQTDLDGKPIVNYYFAAPVELDENPKIVFVRVRETEGDTKRLYVHEVFTEEDIKKADEQQPQGTLTSADLRSFALYKIILKNAYDVKYISIPRDENGEPQFIIEAGYHR
jgi:hypothetical protein